MRLSYKIWLWLILAVLVDVFGRHAPSMTTAPIGDFFTSLGEMLQGNAASHSLSKYFLHLAERYQFPDYIFYLCEATAFFCSGMFALLVGWKFDKYTRAVVIFYFGLTANNFMDEIFFNPSSFDWNEIVFALFVIVRAGYELYND